MIEDITRGEEERGEPRERDDRRRERDGQTTTRRAIPDHQVDEDHPEGNDRRLFGEDREPTEESRAGRSLPRRSRGEDGAGGEEDGDVVWSMGARPPADRKGREECGTERERRQHAAPPRGNGDQPGEGERGRERGNA